MLRSPDSLGRIGGDEFLIVLPDTQEDDAEAVLLRVRRQLEGRVEFSFGVAWVQPGDTFEMVRARADSRMYADKRARHAEAVYR